MSAIASCTNASRDQELFSLYYRGMQRMHKECSQMLTAELLVRPAGIAELSELMKILALRHANIHFNQLSLTYM